MSQSDSLRRHLTWFFAAIVLVGLALLCWLFGGLALRDFRIATKYRETQCHIIDLQMEQSGNKGRQGFSRRRTLLPARPVFIFRFAVDGKTITTSGYDSLDGRDAKSEDYSRFRVGESYPCWFDPADPKKAVLVKAWRPARYWAAVVPLGFILGGLVFLRGLTGGPPNAPRAVVEAERRPVNPPWPRRLPWKFILLGAGATGFIVLAVIVPILAQQRAREAYPEIGGARHDGPALLEKLGLPPGVEATGFRTLENSRSTESGIKRHDAWDAGAAWMAWTHPHATTRDFADLAAWYAAQLGEGGWKVHRAVDADGTEFCQPQWRLKLTRTAVGYDLRLEWNNRFTPASCAHP